MKKFDDIRFQDLQEGLYDQHIFKAFFLAGGPGSGKTFVTHSAFAGHGLKVVNSDSAFENALKKNGLSLKMPDSEEETRDMLRARAKATAGKMLDIAIMGRLGMVIDGTGRDYDKISVQTRMLKELGYDCYMVFVNTTLDVALERNAQRERTIPEYITKSSWQGVQANMGRFQKLFGQSNFLVVDNNKSDLELTTLIMNRVRKEVNKYMRAPISSYIAKRWMAGERKAKRR